MRTPFAKAHAITLGLAATLALHACTSPSAPTAAGGPVGVANVFPPPDQMLLPTETARPAKPVDAAAPSAPRVESVDTIGRTETIEAIVVRFDRPMATDAAQADVLIHLKPAAAGTAHWKDARHLEWRPSAILPLGVSYQGEVVGATSAEGIGLAAPHPFKFATADFRARVDDSATLSYPTVLAENGALHVLFNQPVTPEVVAANVTILDAASKSDLVAEKGTVVAANVKRLEVKGAVTSAPNAADGPNGAGIIDAAFDIRPESGITVGHWYRITLGAALTSPAGSPLGKDEVFYARGREPLAVTQYYCGWPGCTATDTWTVTFNSSVDAAGVAGCLRVDPPVSYDLPSVDYNSITLRPRGLKIGRVYRVTLTTACKDTTGLALAAPTTHDFKIDRPRAILRMPQGVGFLAPTAADVPTTITLGAGWTGKLDVNVQALDRDALVAMLPSLGTDGGGFDSAPLDPKSQVTITPPAASEERVAGVPLALGPHLNKDQRGLVFVRAKTQHVASDDEAIERSALVEVTDLSLVAKATPRETLVWMTSMTTDATLSGVKVELFDLKGRLAWSGLTDDNGLARGPGAPSPDADTAPTFVVTSLGSDLAFLDLRNYATRFEAYRFGLPSDWSAHGAELAGIVFTERGVYKASETVHVKSFVRVDRGAALESLGNKVAVHVTDPVGDQVLQTEVALGAVGDFAIDVPLAANAHLGTYSIAVSVAGSNTGPEAVSGELRGSFRVEAYRANTFEVKVGALTLGGLDVATKISGRYLYGAPMAGAKAHWWVHRAAAAFAPKGFEAFQFGSPSWLDSWWEPSGETAETLAEGDVELGADGTADMSAALDAKALGTESVRLEVEAEVTDVDEQRVAGRSSAVWNPADILPGVRATPDFGAATDPIKAEIVAVATSGDAVAKQDVELRWYRRSWNTRREISAGGGWTWQSEPVEEVITTSRVTTTGATPVVVELHAIQAGTHILEARTTDAHGRVGVSRTEVWLWGDGARWKADNDGTVQVVGERKSHKVGSRARYVVQSPYAASHALVTVEKKGVLWQKTFEFKGTAPVFEVPVTDDMRPNAFVSVVIEGSEPGDADKARTPSARVGYARLDIDNDDRRLAVAVAADKPRYRPGDTVHAKISVKGADGAPATGRVTFMAVDEGVLALTGYKTPDPHAAVNTEKPLAVTTNVARERAWSRLTADLDGEKSDWGGGGETGQATNYRALFATTAAFMPDVALDADGKADVAFKLPDNLTTFRLMSVAASTDGRFGSGDSRIEATKALIVRPGLPRFLSVGDHFDARAVVQAVEASVGGDVQVDVSVTGPVVIEGDVTKSVVLDAGRPKPVTFGARATGPGTAVFAFKARGGSGDPGDAVEVEVPVQWPAPSRRAVASHHLTAAAPEDTMQIQLPTTVRDDTGGLTVTLATSELGQLVPGLRYLIDYPYGCVEQTTGKTLPLLVLRELDNGFTLPGVSSADIVAKGQLGLDRLIMMQTGSGGIGYWPGDEKPHPWGSVYGGYALVIGARTPGMKVPQANVDRLLEYLRTVLNGTADSNRGYWHDELDAVKPFAAYILALAGHPEPSFVATLFEQRAKLPDFAKAFLALAIREGKGEATQVTALLEDILANRTEDGDAMMLRRTTHNYYDSTMDSDARSTAVALLALIQAAPQDPRVAMLAHGLIGNRSEGGTWGWDTQATAFATMALGRYFLTLDRPDGHDVVTVKLGDDALYTNDIDGRSLTPVEVHVPMATVRAANGKALTITKGAGLANLHASIALDWVPNQVPRTELDHGMTVTRTFTRISEDSASKDGRGVSASDLGGHLDNLVAGDLLRVEISVATKTARHYVAVDDLLPAGFEPVTLDFATTARMAGDVARDPERYWSSFNHIEQHDDRVLLFADELSAGVSTTQYLVRATAAGSFLAPAARAHEMYHPEVFGQSDALDVVVK